MRLAAAHAAPSYAPVLMPLRLDGRHANHRGVDRLVAAHLRHRTALAQLGQRTVDGLLRLRRVEQRAAAALVARLRPALARAGSAPFSVASAAPTVRGRRLGRVLEIERHPLLQQRKLPSHLPVLQNQHLDHHLALRQSLRLGVDTANAYHAAQVVIGKAFGNANELLDASAQVNTIRSRSTCGSAGVFRQERCANTTHAGSTNRYHR